MKNKLSLLALCLLLSSFDAQAQKPNLALSADVTVSVSSTYEGRNYNPLAIIDGDRKGVGWETGGGWSDATREVWPDWCEVYLPRSYLLSRVVVVSLQNDFNNPVEPTPTMTTANGLIDFDIQVRDSTFNWRTVAQVRANNKVMNDVSFTPMRGDAVRIYVLSSGVYFSRLVEVEVY